MNLEPLRVLVLLVPALPLLLALWFAMAMAIGVRPRERTVARASLMSIGLGSLASVVVLISSFGAAPLRLTAAHWLFVPGHEIDVAFWIDPLSALMMVMITTISFVVVFFSKAYMHREAGFLRYFLLVNLFIAGMLLLVMADGFVLLFVGWEWVGLTSALLIGFFHERATPVRAGARALFTNRFGDIGLLTASLFASHELGGSDWGSMLSGAATLSPGTATIIGLSLWLAAMAKSAQLPFSSWMVHAVEGPTTSTGLFYGAVMAHAGVYLMLRTMPITAQSDVTMVAMLVIGGATLFYATAAGAAQSDAKSTLIYATIAQLGGMFAACGAGAWQLVVVLMMLHAGLRAAQFLFAPSIIVRTRAAQYAIAANDPSGSRARVVHSGLVGVALVVAAWGAFGLSDLPWSSYHPIDPGPLGRHRDAFLVVMAIASLLTIGWVAMRKPDRRNPDGFAAWLHHAAIDRFRLDELQHMLAVRPLLAAAAALKRFDDRYRDGTRLLATAVLAVAGVLAFDNVATEQAVTTAFAVHESPDHLLPWLSLCWLVPAATAVLVWFTREDGWARTFARGGAVVTLALAVGMLRRFHSDVDGMQFVERGATSLLGLRYHLGVDGIDILFVLLQATVMVLLLVGVGPRNRRATLVATLACHSLGMLALVSENLLVTAVVGLLAIIPATVLLAYDAPRPGGRVATGGYWRPLLLSALLLLGVVIAIGTSMPTTTFDFELIAEQGLPGQLQAILFVPFMISVAIRLPLAPFHGWMVRVIESSSAIAAVTLTLLPLGHYLFLRIGVELLSDALAHHAVLLASYAVVSMGYAVLVGLAQGSLRSSLAYFQLAISGGMLVGVASFDPMGATSGMINAFSLGVAGTGLLLFAETLQVRVGTTDYAALGGIVRTAPILTGLLLVTALAYAGFPGTVGFVAEHLSSHGAFAAHPAIAIAMLAVVNLASVLLWWSFIRTCLGPWRGEHLARFPDLVLRERAVLLVIAVLVIASGWWLEPWVAMVEPTVAAHMPVH
jgi:NADH-quinone oxidoreductase subunit L